MKRSIFVATGLALVIAASAFASTGAIAPKDCVADNSTQGLCAQESKGLEGAYQAVVSKDGKSAYAVGFQDNSIVTFTRNENTGKLTPDGCIADKTDNPDNCSKTTRGLLTPTGLAISDDGKSVYATGRDSSTVAIFKRDTHDGSLDPDGCIVDNDAPADHGCKHKGKALAFPQEIVVSHDGKSVYVASGGDDAVGWLSRDKGDGSLKGEDCVGTEGMDTDNCADDMKGLSHAFALAITKDDESLYVGAEDNAVAHLELKASGKPDPAGCFGDIDTNTSGCGNTFKGLQGVRGVAVSSNGDSVYATGSISNTVVHFERNGTTGNLDAIGCTGETGDNPAGCANNALGLETADGVAVSPDRKSVYVAGQDSSAIARFDRDNSDGKLEDKGCVGDKFNGGDACAKLAKGVGRAASVFVSRKGDSVYSASDTGDTVMHLKRSG